MGSSVNFAICLLTEFQHERGRSSTARRRWRWPPAIQSNNAEWNKFLLKRLSNKFEQRCEPNCILATPAVKHLAQAALLTLQRLWLQGSGMKGSLFNREEAMAMAAGGDGEEDEDEDEDHGDGAAGGPAAAAASGAAGLLQNVQQRAAHVQQRVAAASQVRISPNVAAVPGQLKVVPLHSPASTRCKSVQIQVEITSLGALSALASPLTSDRMHTALIQVCGCMCHHLSWRVERPLGLASMPWRCYFYS